MNLTNNESISQQAAKTDAEILKLIKQKEPISVLELSELTGRTKNSVTNSVNRLKAKLEISSKRKGNTNYWTYGTTPVEPKPERYRPTGYWTGDKFNPASNRPGCLDFLNAPSNINGTLKPYKTPMHGCVSTVHNPSKHEKTQ